MKNLLIYFLLIHFAPAFGYSPKPQSLTYYKSSSGLYMAEMIPRNSIDLKKNWVLSRKYQNVTLFKKGPYAWQEQGSFPFIIKGYDYIKNILVPEDGDIVAIIIDEHPMTKNNKEPAIYILNLKGKIINKYSYFAMYGQPGNFRSSKITLDKDGKNLTVINQHQVPRSVPLKGF